MNRVLVTGATGFVGSHLMEALRGHVEVLATRRSSKAASLSSFPSVLFDLERPSELNFAKLPQVDCVYHLAALVHVARPKHGDEELFRKLNVDATEMLAENAARAGVRRFVFLSSIKVNGEITTDRPFFGSDLPSPEDAYGRSKLHAEEALFRISQRTGMDVVVVRPPLVYGPGVGANFKRLISLVNTGVPLPLRAVNNARSLVNIWNLVDFLIHVMTHERAAGRVWLVSDGEDVSTPRLLRQIGKELGKSGAFLFPMPTWALQLMAKVAGRGGDMRRLVNSLQVDISETREVLGWTPRVSFDEGIARTIAWYRGLNRAAA